MDKEKVRELYLQYSSKMMNRKCLERRNISNLSPDAICDLSLSHMKAKLEEERARKEYTEAAELFLAQENLDKERQ